MKSVIAIVAVLLSSSAGAQTISIIGADGIYAGGIRENNGISVITDSMGIAQQIQNNSTPMYTRVYGDQDQQNKYQVQKQFQPISEQYPSAVQPRWQR